jgi:transcriptional regulator GlxA family with amidase domain
LFVDDRLVERFGGVFYLVAMNLLSASRLPVKRIAQRCGFGSEETMRRSFLRLLSVTPQDYRARFRF